MWKRKKEKATQKDLQKHKLFKKNKHIPISTK